MTTTRICAALFVIAALASTIASCGGGGPKQATASDIEAVQLEPGEDYIQQLKQVVDTNKDVDLREKALLALTDITIRKHETEQVIDFLKDVAINEHEDRVRSAAYAAVDLIREAYPPERRGTLELELVGDIRKNGDVTLAATVSSTVGVEAVLGIARLHKDIEPLDRPLRRLNLQANRPQRVEFPLHLSNVGEYFTRVTVMLSLDRVDHETITKEMLITVRENSGQFLLLEEQ